MEEEETLIISAFPATGKSYFVKQLENNKRLTKGIAIDSDSSTFDKNHFPQNYIDHIKRETGKRGIIFVSSHKVVREALVENEIPFILVYPSDDLKQEYIDRYKKRGNTEAFVKLLDENWKAWLSECKNQTGCRHIVLKSGEYMYDVI